MRLVGLVAVMTIFTGADPVSRMEVHILDQWDHLFVAPDANQVRGQPEIRSEESPMGVMAFAAPLFRPDLMDRRPLIRIRVVAFQTQFIRRQT